MVVVMDNERLKAALAFRASDTLKPRVSLVGGSWPWHSLIKGAKYRAKSQDVLFDLSDDWARARWTGACELTNIPFKDGGKRNIYSASIDRIKHGKDYTMDNCRFILWGINAMRSDSGSDNDVRRIGSAMTKL